jgi:hypothetical protein
VDWCTIGARIALRASWLAKVLRMLDQGAPRA